ncbi:hypothetical protein Ddye_025507 [Dipteronia dyeriana]|uniref:DUF1985 domain-containing protein n=1 Tax=Dipteronia dyeriana TaxID=168575 RepID=A0AAD9WPH5_9ROSI|nr:hypothetical protein Ddye_025507 [Dipteronia dyeriana]
MAEIPYLYRPSNWFHARILIHQREVNHPGGNTNGMWFRVGQTDIRFGKLELCLVTGLQFGMIPTNVVHGYEDVGGCVLDRCFGGKLPTFHMIINLLDAGNFDQPDDAIKLSYLFILGHVLLGIEYRKTVPRWACMFVENLTAFECFPWGTYIYSTTVYYLRRFMTGRNKKSQNSNKKQNLGVNIYGFAWAFKVWAMEAIPCLTGVYGLRISNVYPRLMNWCCKKKPKNLDNEFTDEMEAIPTLTPTADELQQDYMAVFNPENAMGNVPETSKDTVKTYVDPQEVTASDMWEKLLAHVTDQIKAAEKRITESFTRQFKILHEEVQSLRNAPYTQSPNCTSVYDDHHDWGNPSDRSFLDHDSTKATAAAPKPQHMESAPQGDVNHTEAGLQGGVFDQCFSPFPNIEIKNVDLSVESIEKKTVPVEVPGEEKEEKAFSKTSDTHIDCFTRLLKRKIEASPELFKTRIGILPTYFFAQCEVIWKRDYVNTNKTFMEDEWICPG